MFHDISCAAQVQRQKFSTLQVAFAQTGAEIAVLYPAKLCLILEVIECLFYDYERAKKFFEAKSVTSKAEME